MLAISLEWRSRSSDNPRGYSGVVAQEIVAELGAHRNERFDRSGERRKAAYPWLVIQRAVRCLFS
jgi:hypothetical protein